MMMRMIHQSTKTWIRRGKYTSSSTSRWMSAAAPANPIPPSGTFRIRRRRGNETITKIFTGTMNNTPKRKAEEAVNNILYNVPLYKEERKNHILSVLVDNEVGILSKISGLLSARGFNIDSLTVSETDVKELSRMTISVHGQPAQIVQCRRQLEDLVNVWAVVDYTDVWHLNRELVLMKVSTRPNNEKNESEDVAEDSSEKVDDPVVLSHFRRAAVTEMAKMYDAKVIDIGAEHIVLELVSWSRRCDAFIKMMQQFGVLECVRSGMIVMARSRVGGQEEKRSIREVVDLASLPPS